MIHIGTSNIVLPGPKTTYPEECRAMSRLGYYSTLFNAVEINSSFYKVPQMKTTQRWAGEVGAAFRFTLKLWREITHKKGLLFSPGDIESFCEVASGLGKKQGPMLVQLPASIDEQYFDQVVEMLDIIRDYSHTPPWHICVEFRNESWYTKHVYKMLALKKASLVQHDKRGSRTPLTAPLTDVVYLRFHGPSGDYRGTYNEEFLNDAAKRIEKYDIEGRTVYVYFNNTMGAAFDNARQLSDMLRLPSRY